MIFPLDIYIIISLFKYVAFKILTANEACVLQYEFFLLFLATQIRERVDDDAKDQVQHYDDHHEEEQEVVHHASHVQRLLHTSHMYLISTNLHSYLNDCFSFIYSEKVARFFFIKWAMPKNI